MGRSRDNSSTSGGSNELGDFSFSSAPLYASKDEYADKGLIFSIKSIALETGTGYEGQDRWAILIAPSDGRPDELITLGCNEKRDEQMRKAQAFIAIKGPIRSARLKRSGKTYYFENTVQTAHG